MSLVMVAAKASSWVTTTPPRLGEMETLMFEAEPIDSVRLTVLVCCGVPESCTWKPSGVLLTETVGVPEMTPAVGLSDKPAGSVPLVKLQV